MKRRSAIEPVIGHMKNDGLFGRNYLAGEEGDRVNAILCGCGQNIRKLLGEFFLSIPCLLRAGTCFSCLRLAVALSVRWDFSLFTLATGFTTHSI